MQLCVPSQEACHTTGVRWGDRTVSNGQGAAASVLSKGLNTL